MEGNDSIIVGNSISLNTTNEGYTCWADPVTFNILGLALGALGLFGNLCFMYVVMRVKSMQTATNHYLINLAAADLIYLLCLCIVFACVLLRNESCVFVLHEDAHCVIGMVVDIAVLTSNFSVTFIGMERYVAVTKPFLARRLCTKGKTTFFNILMWILALIIKLPSAVACHVDDPPESIYIAIYIIFIAVCFVSLCMVTVLYILTVYHFTKTTKAMREIKDCRHNAPSHDKAVVGLCVMTTIIYFMCLFPKEVTFVLQLCQQLGGQSVSPGTVNCIHNTSIILLMVHSAANPIVYNVMSSRYRQAFRSALLPCYRQNWSRRQGDKSYNYSRTNDTSDKTQTDMIHSSDKHRSTKIRGFNGTAAAADELKKMPYQAHFDAQSRAKSTPVSCTKPRMESVARNFRRPTSPKMPYI
ncbi:somatostatin receptor type 5-like [Ptychodera flava]|uniref:somatostatin receptor type 5-like n=1 Tax=Ptychodera flava TaxID=63121 RepID=UPI00396A2849